MQTYYPYNIDEPQSVTEKLIIKDGMIILRHIPKAGTLTIDGFTEVFSPVNLQSNQFFCYYSADSLYRESNRLVYFYRGLSGQRVTCHYGAVGTPIIADDMNEIKAHIDKGDHDPELVAKVTALSAAVDDLREDIADISINPELQEEVDALSAAVTALNADNNDIWDAITAINRVTDALEVDIFDVETSLSALSAAVTELSYNVDDIDQSIAEEERARIAADNALSERINLLENNSAAGFSALSAAVELLQDDSAAIWGRIANLADVDAELTENICGLSARITAIEKKIDDTPADKTVNDIIFSNKPHDGYNATGKADFLTYVFGADTPTPYSASGASAFIGYIF